ncbi:MAG: sigma-54 interaction domain-containing protein [Pirellulaceae bacterium]
MIITQSKTIQDLIRLAKRVARSNAPVLLTGESGTGKELFSRLIHDSSSRGENKYVTLNCASLPKNLVESELFGHERGSFTDAVSKRVGRFEAAEHGTLLLDEISEIPVSLQAKLLRVLESGTYERVGSSETLLHDVRIIAASNRDLRSEVKDGAFRLDLYHRINIIELKIPPLRDRREDIPLLAMHFVDKFRSETEQKIRGLDNEAMQVLADYHWPGNIRELRNVIHRACILADSEMLTSDAMRLEADELSREDVSDNDVLGSVPEEWLTMELADIEREVILASIDKFGNQRVVAQKLGVSPRTLTNKIRQYREIGFVPLLSKDAA